MVFAQRGYPRKNYDYTQGSLEKAIILLAIPMVFEMVMESVFALVDIYFVSQVSTNAVATIGLTESVVTLIYAVAVGISMAATAVIARRIGEGNQEGAKNTATQIIYIGIAVSFIFSLVGIFYAKDILGLMKASPELIEEGYQYTQILIGKRNHCIAFSHQCYFSWGRKRFLCHVGTCFFEWPEHSP